MEAIPLRVLILQSADVIASWHSVPTARDASVIVIAILKKMSSSNIHADCPEVMTGAY